MHSIIADAHVTAGNVHNSVPYLQRLDRQRERFGFEVREVGLDAGYYTASICKGLSDRGVCAAMPYIRPGGKSGMPKKRAFFMMNTTTAIFAPKTKSSATARPAEKASVSISPILRCAGPAHC